MEDGRLDEVRFIEASLRVHPRSKVFDIGHLAQRLLAGTQWAANQPETAGLPIGLFGASTGAAAALVAAAMAPAAIAAVVSRGGRPDLAGDALSRVAAPTLLLVGSRDEPVLGLNRQAFTRLTCPKRLVVVPGADHLFEEAGTLENASAWAAQWYGQSGRLTIWGLRREPPGLSAKLCRTVSPAVQNPHRHGLLS